MITRLKFLPSSNLLVAFLRSTSTLFFLFFFSSLSAQEHFVRNISLTNLFETLEKNYNVTFSYDVNLIKGKKIQYFQYSNKSLEKDLIKLLRDSDLGFQRIDRDIIIKRVPPDFFEKYTKTICGQIIDAKEGLPLGHAAISVYNMNAGLSTDSLGQFTLQGPFVSSDILSASFIGYEPKELEMSFFLDQPCKTIFLRPKELAITQVIVREDYNQFAGIKLSESEPDVTIIRPDKMEGAGGLDSKDVFGILKQLPGVNSSNESATSLNVRGGTSGQNLVMYDDIPLYHYGHLFGKISSFNSDLIGQVKFNKSSFSSQNGGRMASIIDIRGKKSIPKKINLKAKVGVLSAGISGEMPFAKNKAALMVGYRKSIFDKSKLNNIIFDQIFQNTRVDSNSVLSDSIQNVMVEEPSSSFYDFFAKAIWQPTSEDFIEVTGLKLGDRLKYSFAGCVDELCSDEQDSLGVSNIGFSASWKHDWKPNFYSTINYSYSGFDKKYHFSNKAIDTISIFERKRNRIQDFSFQINNQWQRNDVRINFGYQHKKIKALIDNYEVWDIPVDSFYDSSTGLTNSLFIDYRHELSDKFHLFLGNRLSTYNLLKKGLLLEPRFTATSNPSKYLKIKMSGGLYYQTMNQLLRPDDLFGTDEIWVLSKDIEGANQNLFSVQKGSQFSVGASYRRDSWQGSVEVYDKLVDGIPSQVLDFQVVSPNSVGSLNALGVELGLQKWGEKAYTILSWSQGTAEYQFPWPKDPIAAAYHHHRQVNFVQGYRYKGLVATVSWTWKSGLPYSEMTGVTRDSVGPGNYNYSIDYDAFNQNRLPSYSRFDLSLMYSRAFKWGTGSLTFSALNVLNQTNVLNRRYDLLISQEAHQGLAEPGVMIKERKGLPFTPNLVLTFEFGMKNPFKKMALIKE